MKNKKTVFSGGPFIFMLFINACYLSAGIFGIDTVTPALASS